MNRLADLLQPALALYLLASMLTQGRLAWRFAASRATRRQMYWRTIVWQWSFVATLGLALPLRRLVWPTLAGAAYGPADPALVFVVVANVLLVMYLPIAGAWRHRGLRRQVIATFAPVRALLPTTPGQRGLWALLSLTTGICEELLFRGFALQFLTATLGLPFLAGALVTSAAFGVGHANQGLRGVLRTTLFGAAMCALVLASGSLVLPMFVHALVNLRIALLPAAQPRHTS